MYKPINRRYHDLDDPNTQSSMTWDLSNGDEIVVENLITFGEVTDGKEQLTALAQEVCDSYEENLLWPYRDWETDRKSTRLNSSHRSLSRMPSSA